MADRNTNRLKIKKAVQDAVPMAEIDVTKVLSPEESAELIRQMHQRSDALKLAKEVGREGLRERLKKTIMMMVKKAEDGIEEDSE